MIQELVIALLHDCMPHATPACCDVLHELMNYIHRDAAPCHVAQNIVRYFSKSIHCLHIAFIWKLNGSVL